MRALPLIPVLLVLLVLPVHRVLPVLLVLSLRLVLLCCDFRTSARRVLRTRRGPAGRACCESLGGRNVQPPGTRSPSYWRSFSTVCGIWFACATIAVPACCNT